MILTKSCFTDFHSKNQKNTEKHGFGKIMFFKQKSFLAFDIIFFDFQLNNFQIYYFFCQKVFLFLFFKYQKVKAKKFFSFFEFKF